jgi:hypothetical protein
MYLQKVIRKNTTKIAGFGSGSGAVSQRYGSEIQIRTKMSRICNSVFCFFKAAASEAAAAGGVRPAAAEPARLHLGGGPVPGQPARGGGDLPLPGGGAAGSHAQGREVRPP